MSPVKSPKVCFISLSSYGYFNPSIGYTGGGAQRQLYLLSQELKSSFDVHFIVGDYSQPKTEKRAGVTLHRGYEPESSSKTNTISTLFNIMRQIDADIYIDRNTPSTAAATFLCSRLLRKKWLYNVANDANIVERPSELSFPLRWLYARSMRNADGIIAQTAHQSSLIRENYGRSVNVVPNGYPPLNQSEDSLEREYFLWVGRLDKTQKQPRIFLELAETHPEYEFRLIGPSENMSDGYDLKRKINLQENIEYLGAVRPDRIHKYYSRAIALVNTSEFEGFPNTFLESWRVGTPVLSLNIPFDRLCHQMDVFGCANGDIEALNEMLVALAERSNFRSRTGDKCRDIFEKNLKIGNVARGYETAILDVLDR